MISFFEQSYPNTSERGALAPKPSDCVYLVRLEANKAKRIAVPVGGAYLAIVSDANYFVAYGTATVDATVPATGDILTGNAPEYMTGLVQLPPGVTHISFFSTVANQLSLSWYGA